MKAAVGRERTIAGRRGTLTAATFIFVQTVHGERSGLLRPREFIIAPVVEKQRLAPSGYLLSRLSTNTDCEYNVGYRRGRLHTHAGREKSMGPFEWYSDA